LKPSNILVTPDGEPKLLDFGIAKLLDSTEDATRTEARVLTPAYASPEQRRGEIVGTSSDVYSLGVILRELMTDESPMRIEEIELWKTKGDKGKSVGRTNPNASLSTLGSPLLTGDLQIIVAQATREDTERRYASVEAFSEDLRRYLAGLPIAARKDSTAYRASKFFQRNRLAVAVAGLFVLSLIGGIAATLWQARIAQRERALAERRFESLQKSSRSMVSEIHQAMLNLPGSLDARKLLLQRAVEQLDTLAEGAGGNRQLQLDLAAAYQNIGNLPDKPIAERTELFDKAIGFYQKILAGDAQNIEARKGLAMSKVNLADFARLRSETEEALNYNRESVALLESVVADEPENLKHKTALWNVSYNMALTLTQTGRASEALEICRHILPIAVELKEKDSTDPSTHKFRRPYLSRALATSNLIFLGKYDEATTEIRQALDENAQTRAQFPEGMIERLDEGVFNHHLAIALERGGRREQAIEAMKKSPAIIEQLIKDDPKDVRNQTSAAQYSSMYGHLLVRAGKPDAAVEYFNRAIELNEKVIAADAAQKQAKADLAYAYGGRGNALARTGKTAEGLADGRKALTLYEESAAANSSNIVLLRNYAETLAETGENYLLAGADKSPDKARDLLEQSLAIWLRMREREMLSSFDAEQPEKIRNRLEQLSGGV
jgi:tetratricopeptide (TPR) repeat protein